MINSCNTSVSNSRKVRSSAATLFAADCFAIYLNERETWEMALKLKTDKRLSLDSDDMALIEWVISDDGTTTRTYINDSEEYCCSNMRNYAVDGSRIGRIEWTNTNE